MSHPTHREAGNAVTLTLLGLAVAILAGVAVLYVVGKQKPVPIPVTQPNVPPAPAEPTNPRAGWNTYEDSEYSFAFEYPNGWGVATGTVLGMPVVTAYAGGQNIDASSTLGVHGLATRFSVYPLGMHGDETGDRETTSAFTMEVSGATVYDHLLGATGRAWATMARFETVPEGWSDAGTVFVRAYIQDELVTYVDTEGLTISESAYDASSGDKIVREGFVDPLVRGIEEEMLRSFRFTNNEEGGLNDLIRVTSPIAGDRISSPLTVSGSARGNWFFEGSFPITLITDDGEELSTVPALAQDNWMTEEFVPFTVSMTFPTTTATSGVLRLMRDNPSGLPEHDQSIEISVTF